MAAASLPQYAATAGGLQCGIAALPHSAEEFRRAVEHEFREIEHKPAKGLGVRSIPAECHAVSFVPTSIASGISH